MIAIRTDANEKIAMGHLMRCLSIAKQLKEKEQEVIFFISEEYAISQIQQSGFECICLHNDYADKESEIEMISELVKEYKVEKLLLDSYQVTEYYMSALRKMCRIIYIDDLNCNGIIGKLGYKNGVNYFLVYFIFVPVQVVK